MSDWEIGFARGVFLVFFGLLLGMVVLLPTEYIFRGAPSRALWRDLRIWAVVLIAAHVVIYWVF